jgi:hypothetical protein
MEKRGALVQTIGNYKIYERIHTALNNRESIVGYQLLGPGADTTWNFDLEVAIKEARNLDDKHRR